MGKNINGLLSELDPLIKYLAGTSDYKKLRFTVSDIEGFLVEKLYNVWLRYYQSIPYEEVKAIAIASLYNYRGKIYKKYSREVSLEEQVVPDPADSPYRDLLGEAVQYLSQNQAVVLEILVDPPFFIRDRISLGKRIPSHVILEYLDIPIDKRSVKKLNVFRKDIFKTLEKKVPQHA